MIDQELKNHLEKIEKEIEQTRKSSTNITNAFLRGAVHGAGYIIGAALIIIIIGWVLNVVGIIPAFNREVTELRALIENISGKVK